MNWPFFSRSKDMSKTECKPCNARVIEKRAQLSATCESEITTETQICCEKIRERAYYKWKAMAQIFGWKQKPNCGLKPKFKNKIKGI